MGWGSGTVVQVRDTAWILAAVALIGPLAWELPYATGAAVKAKKKKEKEKVIPSVFCSAIYIPNLSQISLSN